MIDYIDPAVAIPLAVIFWSATAYTILKPEIKKFFTKENA